MTYAQDEIDILKIKHNKTWNAISFENLGNPTKRRSYDSVDPMFDDSLPTQSEINKNFYETFSKYFGLNGRWSEKKNVPVIGNKSLTNIVC